MSLKDGLEKVGNDIKDAARETKHRVVADAEHGKRDLLGDEMTLGEKGKSIVNEAKNRGAAEIDKTKRDLRDKSDR
jgi:vacuolar-type H+-ATPase subunit E/Vma4